MTVCVFLGTYLSLCWFNKDRPLPISALTGLLSLLQCAALTTKGNSTILCVCVCSCVREYVCVQVCKYRHVDSVWEFNYVTA